MKIEWENSGNFHYYNNCCLFIDDRCRGVVTRLGLNYFKISISNRGEESFEGSSYAAKARAIEIATGDQP